MEGVRVIYSYNKMDKKMKVQEEWINKRNVPVKSNIVIGLATKAKT